MGPLTRDEADRIARQAARRADGDGTRLLQHVSEMDAEVAAAIRDRLAEIGADALASLAQSAAA
jgi:dihydrodipicolinate synthase/N-acetylneuraminate lyase